MKSFYNFINEHQKFQVDDFVKRKIDGKIGKVDNISTYTDGMIRYMKYVVNFGEAKGLKGIRKYLAKELEIPTKDEVDLHFDTQKYNL